MMLDRYELKAGTNFTTFEFVSEGRKGKVTKVIQFQSMDYTGLYNLAFGDLMADGKIDDIVITDNGDSKKILATVVAAIYAFTHKYPDAWVYATGSTDGRTRLYRMWVSISILKLYKLIFKFLGTIKMSGSGMKEAKLIKLLLFGEKKIKFGL